MSRNLVWLLAAALSLAACDAAATATPTPVGSEPALSSLATEAPAAPSEAAARRSTPWRLVSLGDAYTAGYATDLPRRDSWPAQVVDALKRSEVDARLTNLAVRGYSSGQVLEEQLGEVAPYEPDLVTLQVGINDLLYGETAWYRGNLTAILDELLGFLPPERILVITTPDDALDGAGDTYGAQAEVRAAIAALNRTMAEVAEARGIVVVDIGLINGLGDADGSLVVEDGPYSYPTAKQYAGWAEAIGGYVHRALAMPGP